MNKNITKHLGFLLLSVILVSSQACKSQIKENNSILAAKKEITQTNLLTHFSPRYEDGDVNAVIEIPSGTVQKWELNKSNGQIEWEVVNNKPRIVNYLGYPGNYGLIPRTLLSKEHGGDGDPLDILVLGPPAERGQVIKCKIIGVLYLTDRGEQDDKIIAISTNSPLYNVKNINDLNKKHVGIPEIIQLWFTNYKGPGKMESNGFGDKKDAIAILMSAINQYTLKDSEHKK